MRCDMKPRSGKKTKKDKIIAETEKRKSELETGILQSKTVIRG